MKILLTNGDFAVIDDNDEWIVKGRSWHVNGKGYVHASIGGKMVRMHRLIMGAPDGVIVDHINGDKLDNRRGNLRLCTNSQNMSNRSGVNSNNTTGYLGVSWEKGRFRARVESNGKSIHIGRFRCPVEAAIARDVAAMDIHGEFCSLNFPEIRDLFHT